MTATNIEWCTDVWNPTRGCSRVSEGCRNCYAERQAIRQSGPGGKYEGLVKSTPGGPKWTGRVALDDKTLLAPLRWKKPRTIFVNSMSDLFHEALTDEQIDRVFAVMALSPQHTFLVLTKRAERMREYLCGVTGDPMGRLADDIAGEVGEIAARAGLPRSMAVPFAERIDPDNGGWPLPNLALGVSVEDRATADARVPALLDTPAAIRWVSYEPALGGVDWALFVDGPRLASRLDRMMGGDGSWRPDDACAHATLDGIVMGGESGPGARPMHPDWVRWTRDQCAAAGVNFFFKQWGAWAPCGPVVKDNSYAGGAKFKTASGGQAAISMASRKRGLYQFPEGQVMESVGKKAAGRLLDGREHNDLAWSVG